MHGEDGADAQNVWPWPRRTGPVVEAVRRALPEAVQAADHRHLRHGLCAAVDREVEAHSSCWAPVLGQHLYDGPRAQSTLERRRQVHDLLERGVGLLECARRLQPALNTVKRYARAEQPERMLRVPPYRPTLVDPCRDHRRRHRDEEPGVPVKHLFEEIKTLGCTGSLNLPHKYINQGRVEADRSPIFPRRLSRILLGRPDRLTDTQRALVDKVAAGCTEMSVLLEHVSTFAALLHPARTTLSTLPTGWRAPGPPPCPTCAPSPAACARTSPPSPQPVPAPSATAAPKVSTTRPS